MARPKSNTAAVIAPVKKQRKPRSPKAHRYLIIDSDGVVGEISSDYTSEKAMLVDVMLAAGDGDTVVVYREAKRGKLMTKVKLGKI